MKTKKLIEEVEKGCGRIVQTGFSSYICGKKDGRFKNGYKLCGDCEKGIKPKTMLERIQEQLIANPLTQANSTSLSFNRN